MKKIFISAFFLLIFSAVYYSQTPVPAATVKPADDGDDIVKISTSLIQLDVKVTDKNGKPVADLKPQDFEIYENGKKQQISNFSLVSQSSTEISNSVAASATAKTAKTNTVVVPVVPLRAEQVRRTISIVVDDLGLSAQSMNTVRKTLRKFVDVQMQPNDLVAIVKTGSTGGPLQQFTSNKQQLYAAIENLKYYAGGRGGATAFDVIEAAPVQPLGGPLPDTMGGFLEETRLKNLEIKAAKEERFAVAALNNMMFVVNGMRELPGNKSLMLFSDGFVLQPSYEISDRTNRGVFTLQAMQKLIDLANRSSITINAIDARGLQNMGIDAADNVGGSVRLRKSPGEKSLLDKQLQDRVDELNTKQDGLVYLAKQTGGEAFYNNNDLNAPITKVLTVQSDFYLLGYQPDEETFNPKEVKFNKIEIKVNRPDLTVSYRSGFLNEADKPKETAPKTPAQQIQAAITSPFAVNGIAVRLNTLLGKGADNTAFVQSYLHINAQDLQFAKEGNGNYKADFEVLAVSFGTDGLPVEQTKKGYTVNVNEARYKEMLERGFVYDFLFPIKKPGAYQMRVAIRDSTSAKVGSASQFIEVPNLKNTPLVLSGIILQNYTQQQWANLQNAAEQSTGSLMDNSQRRFKRGTILKYGGELYLTKDAIDQKGNLQTQFRIIRDGNIILEGKAELLNANQPSKTGALNYLGALNLIDKMIPGEYTLQIIAANEMSKGKGNLASQAISFEVID